MPVDLPHQPLAYLPTPLEPLPHLSRVLGGPQLFIKRDDHTGLAGGGNKTRKLELLLADALTQGADTLVTVGAPQSNHCRQTAAAAARCGLRCMLILGGHPPVEITGNILLDQLLGAEIFYAGDLTREAKMEQVVAAEAEAGYKVYPIPLGGSNPLGAAAYVQAWEELTMQVLAQNLHFDRIVFASSSGGTQAGLVLGAHLTSFGGQLLGISVDHPQAHLQNMVAHLATQTSHLLGHTHTFEPATIQVNADYLGAGYAQMGDGEREAIELFARHEGILLDPVYTGRAAAGLIDLILRGAFTPQEKVLFWHTGGMPALWAYAQALRR